MYDYVELQTEHNELGRWYTTPSGIAYPSITTVLGGTTPPEKAASLQAWRDGVGAAEADAVTEEACRHGTTLHTLIERFLGGEDVFAPINGEEVIVKDRGAFNTLKPKLKHLRPWGLEKCLWSTELEVAGRTDFVGLYRDVESIVDYKTSRKLKDADKIEDYRLQLCFYAKAHNELYGTNIQRGVILMASNGFPQEWIVDLRAEAPRLLNRVTAFWTSVLDRSS